MSDYKKEIMEAFRKKFELHDVGKSQFTICTNSGDNTCNGGVSVDEIELESAEKLLENIESFLSQALTRVEEAARKEERKKIVQVMENRKTFLESKENEMLEKDSRDMATYKRDKTEENLQRVKLNEGTTAHHFAGMLRGKIEELTYYIASLSPSEEKEFNSSASEAKLIKEG